MKTLATLFAIIFMFGIPSGCQQVETKPEESGLSQSFESHTMNDKEHNIVKKLRWLEGADPKADALSALNVKNQKPELIAFAGRGKSFPGLTSDEYKVVVDLTTFRYAEGSGDVIYGETHKRLRRQLRDYVSIYNRTIYDAVAVTR